MSGRGGETPNLYRKTQLHANSPYYLGKPKKKPLPASNSPGTPRSHTGNKENRASIFPEMSRRQLPTTSADPFDDFDDDIILENSADEKRPEPSPNTNVAVAAQSPSLAPVPHSSSSRGMFVPPPPAKKSRVDTQNGAKGEINLFNFDDDPKVLEVKRRIGMIVDPEGKNQNIPPSTSTALNDRIKAQSNYVVHGRKEKKPKGSEIRRPAANLSDFQMASGKPVSKATSKFLPPITNNAAKTGEMDNNGAKENENNRLSGGNTTGGRYYGNKPMPGGSFNAGAAAKKAIEMTMAQDGSGPDQVSSSAKRLQMEPSLKNFDTHIIELIDSEIMSVICETGWSDVAGLDGAKKALREIVVLPFLRPEIFKGIRAPPKGVLLFGPPGTGKTMIGKCVASQCKATFFNISASSLTSKWVGEGEKLVRALFAVARIKLPSVIFIDEVDSLLSSRNETEHESSRRIKTEFLVQLDGVATNADERLLVIGATNRPQELDEAARRRFAKRLYIGLPESRARENIVRNLLTDMSHQIGEVEMSRIAELTKGYSGADMRQLCSEAAMGPIRDIDNDSLLDIQTVEAEQIRPIAIADFEEATQIVRPTVVEEELSAYHQWNEKFGCLR